MWPSCIKISFDPAIFELYSISYIRTYIFWYTIYLSLLFLLYAPICTYMVIIIHYYTHITYNISSYDSLSISVCSWVETLAVYAIFRPILQKKSSAKYKNTAEGHACCWKTKYLLFGFGRAGKKSSHCPSMMYVVVYARMLLVLIRTFVSVHPFFTYECWAEKKYTERYDNRRTSNACVSS